MFAITMMRRYTPISPSENIREQQSTTCLSRECDTFHMKETTFKNMITMSYSTATLNSNLCEMMSLHDPKTSSLCTSALHTALPATQHISGTGAYTLASFLQ